MPTPADNAVARVVVDLPVGGPFDYAVPPEESGRIAVGSRVQVPFHFRKLVGCVVGLQETSELPALKQIIKVLDEKPVLSGPMLRLTRAFAGHYGCSWGEAVAATLPSSLRRSGFYPPRNKEWTLNPPATAGDPLPGERYFCFDHAPEKFWPQLAARVRTSLVRNEDVIMLVPEAVMIVDVRQALKRNGLGERLIILDKQLSPAKELAAWHAARERQGVIVVGTRSAVFAPVGRPGLYVMLGADHPAYKQEQVPCYHARDVVLLRRQTEGGEVLFFGAAPSLETLMAVGGITALPQITEADLAPLQTIDLANYKPKHRSALSFPVQTQVRETLEKGGRVVLMYNRRGFSTLIRCNQCGHALRCERCNVAFTYSPVGKVLTCSSCGGSRPLPSSCPECRGDYLRHLGGGVERLEADMRQYFPAVPVGRCDAGHPRIPVGARLIVATQAVVRLLPQIRPELIVVLDLDAELSRFDFRSANRCVDALLQLRAAGRRVVVQTNNPGHYALRAAVSLDLAAFYKEELAQREELQFPPCCHLVAVVVRGPNETAVQAVAAALFSALQTGCPDGIEVMDPQPDFQAKLRDQFRLTMMIKGRELPVVLRHVQVAQAATRKKKDVIVTLNVDP